MEPSEMEEPESAKALVALHAQIAEAIMQANKLNEKDEPTRSRSLSLAVTNLEQAMHWTEDAYRQAIMEAYQK